MIKYTKKWQVNRMNCVIILIYVIEIIIYAVIAHILMKKHSEFPDFSVGYHVKEAMESKEKWDFSNKTAGILCIVFSVIFLISAVITFITDMSRAAVLILFFTVSVTSVIFVILVPAILLKKRF